MSDYKNIDFEESYNNSVGVTAEKLRIRKEKIRKRKIAKAISMFMAAALIGSTYLSVNLYGVAKDKLENYSSTQTILKYADDIVGLNDEISDKNNQSILEIAKRRNIVEVPNGDDATTHYMYYSIQEINKYLSRTKAEYFDAVIYSIYITDLNENNEEHANKFVSDILIDLNSILNGDPERNIELAHKLKDVYEFEDLFGELSKEEYLKLSKEKAKLYAPIIRNEFKQMIEEKSNEVERGYSL